VPHPLTCKGVVFRRIFRSLRRAKNTTAATSIPASRIVLTSFERKYDHASGGGVQQTKQHAGTVTNLLAGPVHPYSAAPSPAYPDRGEGYASARSAGA